MNKKKLPADLLNVVGRNPFVVKEKTPLAQYVVGIIKCSWSKYICSGKNKIKISATLCANFKNM